MAGTNTMKIVFMGTPEFAVPALNALYAEGYEILAVYSQPPRPTGRGHKVHNSPTHRWALDHNVPVRTPLSLKGDLESQILKDLNPDLVVVAAYGLLLPKSVLDIPRFGCINIHGSLLPRWRGAAPIHRALMDGDSHTGITIMGMEIGLDTGSMYKKESIPILSHSTYQSLHDELSFMGGRLLVEVLKELGSISPVPQPENGVTYAHKILKSESVIDWQESAVVLERKVRALNPWPGVTFEHNGERIKIMKAQVIEGEFSGIPGEVLGDTLAIQTGSGALQPLILQRPGGKPLEVDVFLKSMPIPKGTIFRTPDATV